MNRAEFMGRLTELLGDVPSAEREAAIQYYNDYFDDAGTENESGVIASLGTPEELAGVIKAGLNDGGNSGEFTESGFSAYSQVHKDEIMRTGEAAQQTGHLNHQAGADNNGAQENNAYYQGAYYQRTGGRGIYGGREDTRKQFNPYEEPDSGQAGSAGGQETPPPKQGMSGGAIALIVILAVLTSPLWIGLVTGLLGIVAGIAAGLFGVFLVLLIIGAVFVVVAVALVVVGIAILFSAPLAGISMIGTAFVLFAIGLVCIWLMVLTAAMAIPALVRGIAALGRRIFHRGGAQA